MLDPLIAEHAGHGTHLHRQVGALHDGRELVGEEVDQPVGDRGVVRRVEDDRQRRAQDSDVGPFRERHGQPSGRVGPALFVEQRRTGPGQLSRERQEVHGRVGEQLPAGGGWADDLDRVDGAGQRVGPPAGERHPQR